MSFPSYPAYKDSGVAWLGDVPSHWAVKRLRRAVQLNPSKSETAALSRSEEVTFLPMEAIGEDGSLVLDRLRPIGELESGYTYFAEGDVAIAKITPCFENGKGAVMRDLHGGLGFGTTELIVARPLPKHLDSGYLHRIFTSRPFMQQGEASMYGAGGQKRVPDDFVRDFAIALPPVDEQVVINAFLDRETAKIDALVAEQEQLITLLKEKRQAVISHAVTKGLDPSVPMKDSGVEWLGEVPAHWEVTHLKRRCSLITDGAHISPETEGGVHLFVSTKDISDDGIDFDGALRTSPASYEYMVKTGCQPTSGDVLFSKDGTIGRTVVVNGATEFVVASSLIVIRPIPDQLNSDFLNALCQSWVVSQQVDGFVKGAGLPRLSIQNLLKVIGVFPPIDEQVQIASYLSDLDLRSRTLALEAERTVTLLKERRSALISAAVTGQIDVRGLAPAQAQAT